MISILEHFILFMILALLVTLVYSGLRQDSIKTILGLAGKRFFFFMTASAVLAVSAYYFASFL